MSLRSLFPGIAREFGHAQLGYDEYIGQRPDDGTAQRLSNLEGKMKFANLLMFTLRPLANHVGDEVKDGGCKNDHVKHAAPNLGDRLP